MFADLFPAEDTDMVVDARDEEMPDAPPLITPTDPYRWNFEAQSNWNVALRSGGVAQSTTKAHSRARLDPIFALAANSATPPHTKYTIVPAYIPPELWLEESNRIRDWSGLTPPSTQLKRRPHLRFDQPLLFEPRMRKPRRKDGAFRSLYIHQNGPRLALNAPAPQVSTEEAENIRKLECESYLEYRCSLRRSKPHGRSTEGGPFGCPTPSNSLGSSELSSSSSASSASSYSSSSSASHSSGPASESSYEDELNSADSDVDDAEDSNFPDSFVDPDDFVSATSEDSEGSHSSSASWVSYSTSDSHGRRLSPPPGRHERVARMHDHQRRRDGGRGLWQRLMNALPNLCSAV